MGLRETETYSAYLPQSEHNSHGKIQLQVRWLPGFLAVCGTPRREIGQCFVPVWTSVILRGNGTCVPRKLLHFGMLDRVPVRVSHPRHQDLGVDRPRSKAHPGDHHGRGSYPFREPVHSVRLATLQADTRSGTAVDLSRMRTVVEEALQSTSKWLVRV
jgi:hypothetical protein